MISVTNDAQRFIENSRDEIVIYGAGNAGYWVGHFLVLCGIEFSYYIDKKTEIEGIVYKGHPVFTPSKLSEQESKTIRIIITPHCCDEILGELLILSNKYSFNALCLRPVYYYSVYKQERYDINTFLSYFRRRLFIGNIPTIISNDCIGAELYNLMGMIPKSPTINTTFESEDFKKVFTDPEKYLKKSIHNLVFEKSRFGQYHPSEVAVGADLEDVHFRFSHVDREKVKDFNSFIERWEFLKGCIDWGSLVFVLRANEISIPVNVLRDFSRIKGRKLLVYIGDSFTVDIRVDTCCFKENIFFKGNDVIENHFDLVGWFNDTLDQRK